MVVLQATHLLPVWGRHGGEGVAEERDIGHYGLLIRLGHTDVCRRGGRRMGEEERREEDGGGGEEGGG